MVAIDAKRVRRAGGSDRWEIFTHGGRKPTGIDAIEYAQEVVSLGAGEILLTSMDRDGTRQGFDLPLTQAIADSVPVPVIASGGVGNLDHLVDGIRRGPRDRGAGGLDIPLRRIHHTAGQGAHGARRAADAARSLTTRCHKSAKSCVGRRRGPWPGASVEFS